MEKEIKSVKQRYIDAFKDFFDKLYGVDLDYTKTREYKMYLDILNGLEEDHDEDYDIMITIKHRYGDYKLKNIDSYTRPKSILEVVEKGITLPDDVNSMQIIARIATYVNNKREFLPKKENTVFTHKIVFNDEVETKAKVEQQVGQKIGKMDPAIRAFSKEDFISFSKLIKFKQLTKDEEVSV